MGYTSLRDLYTENVVGKKVPALPRQQVHLQEQTGKTFVPGNDYVPQIPWSEFNLPADLFDKISKKGKMDKEGTGRGEYSAALS